MLLGWTSSLPELTGIRESKEEHRPQSADPEFWEVWRGQEECDVDWDVVAKECQRTDRDDAGDHDIQFGRPDDDEIPF